MRQRTWWLEGNVLGVDWHWFIVNIHDGVPVLVVAFHGISASEHDAFFLVLDHGVDSLVQCETCEGAKVMFLFAN